MTNTRAQGDAFRDRVHALLRLRPGIRNLQREWPVAHQAVDIYYEEAFSFRVFRVACECKDYGKPLTRSVIETEIYPKYAPLLNKGHVDAVRIITPLPIAVDAQRYLDTCNFTLSTVDELEATIMDFGSYLVAMRVQFADEGLDQYYCDTTFADGEDAEQYLTDWADRDGDARPVAVLATYGMGKSSLARRFAWRQADRHQHNQARRIPILIRLGDISNEQDIRGLITKHLAAQHVVPHFHYELFRELNRRGRFVVIFDGFDEMKHTLSGSEIQFNFDEINKLVEGSARVLLLGRPTVFKDVHERNHALHGVREDQRRVAEGVDYVEKDIKEFDVARALELMRAYGRYALTREKGTRADSVSADQFEERLQHVSADQELTGLSQRPVQAKMLVDLALDPHIEWRSFSRYELYKEFVDGFLAREMKKAARKRFSLEQRAAFQRALAWWMWGSGHTSSFERRVLPRQLYGQYLVHADETDGVARDLITGTLLDHKPPDRYFFRHRSYLEFLVAEHICIEEWTAPGVREVSDLLTPEIVEFIRDSPEIERLEPLHTWLNTIEGPASRLYIELLAHSEAAAGRPSELYVALTAREVFVHLSRFFNDGAPLEKIVALTKEVSPLLHRDAQIAALSGLILQAFLGTPHADPTKPWPSRLFLPTLAELLRTAEDEMRRLLQAYNEKAGAAISAEALTMRLIAASLSRAATEKQEPVLVFDLYAFFNAAILLLDDQVRLAQWSRPGDGVKVVFSLAELSRVAPDFAFTKPLGKLASRFFERVPEPRSLVAVTTRRPPVQRSVLRLNRDRRDA